MQTQTVQQVKHTRPRALRRLFLEVVHDDAPPAFVPPAETVPVPFVSDSGAVVEIIQLSPVPIKTALLSVLSKESGLANSDPREKAKQLADKAKTALSRTKRVIQAGKSTTSASLLSFQTAVKEQISPAVSVSGSADIAIREVPLGYKAVIELFPVETDPVKQKELEDALKKVEESVKNLEQLADLSKTRFFKDGLTLAEAYTYVKNFFASAQDPSVLSDLQTKSSRNLKAHTELRGMTTDERGIDIDEGLIGRVHKTWSLMKSVLEHKHLAENGIIFFTVLSSVQSQMETFGGELQHFDEKNMTLKKQAASLQLALKEKAGVLGLADFAAVSQQLDELEKTIRTKLGI